jgi:nitroimidazol reductase NimA-like FMN-containing flavoprotein (pyridoxamine 5'-phosphate oxidase superfamily)
MRTIYKITDENLITEMLKRAIFGVLALADEQAKPYAIPLNFVRIDNSFYFHGSKKGRKIEAIQANKQASLSIVESYVVVPSYFASDSELACPATHLNKSIIVDGTLSFVEEHKEKARVLAALMKKLQPEGGYKPLSDAVYKKAIQATTIFKLTPVEMSAKFKFGQQVNQEVFEKIIYNLEKRGTDLDIETVQLMKSMRFAKLD